MRLLNTSLLSLVRYRRHRRLLQLDLLLLLLLRPAPCVCGGRRHLFGRRRCRCRRRRRDHLLRHHAAAAADAAARHGNEVCQDIRATDSTSMTHPREKQSSTVTIHPLHCTDCGALLHTSPGLMTCERATRAASPPSRDETGEIRRGAAGMISRVEAAAFLPISP